MIVCTNLCKSYKLGGSSRTVLDKVNLVVEKGDRLALLGRNGAGKSTLIKLIGGVELPTSGQIERKMTVSWPLGFTGGFQGSLTGYDNARFIARIYGREYDSMRSYIEEFTELGQKLKMPVKTYSSGMRARLAFGLSLAIEFDCYLIDEIIMVGDQNFQRKCQIELFEKRSDRTLVLASHNEHVVREYCNKAAIVRNGQVNIDEAVDRSLDIYTKL